MECRFLIVFCLAGLASSSTAIGQIKLPPLESEGLAAILSDSWTLFYDSGSLPQAMQMGINDSPVTIHRAKHRFNNIDRTTNANAEYPWEIGGGLHLTPRDELEIVKFFWHPKQRPVAWYPSIRRGRQQAYDWVFPIDAVVGEIIAIRGAPACEIRTLTRELDGWTPRVYRQYNTRQDVAQALQGEYPDLAAQVLAARGREWKLFDDTHPRPAIAVDYFQVMLPSFPEGAVSLLRQAPLREVFEPTELTAAESQIIPADYRGAHVGIDRSECLQCHRHVGAHVDEFGPPNREWYGYVRGSDQIFSFHPFARSSIANNGARWPVSINQDLVRSGHLTRWNGQEGYHSLP